jgi:hypothetical protein
MACCVTFNSCQKISQSVNLPFIRSSQYLHFAGKDLPPDKFNPHTLHKESYLLLHIWQRMNLTQLSLLQNHPQYLALHCHDK